MNKSQVVPEGDRVVFVDMKGDKHRYKPVRAIELGDRVDSILGGPTDLACALRAHARGILRQQRELADASGAAPEGAKPDA